MAAQQRQQRSEQSRKVRQAMKTGDERYYLARDKGPVRRFIRDFVDSRFSFLELMIPAMLVVLVLGYSGNQRLMATSNFMLLAMFMLIIVDIATVRFKVRRELARRFPGERPRRPWAASRRTRTSASVSVMGYETSRRQDVAPPMIVATTPIASSTSPPCHHSSESEAPSEAML
jgi:hypothetical protein